MPGFVLSTKDLKTIDKKYLCNSCKLVLREPLQTECGHHYCRECVERLSSESSTAKCLVDQHPITKTSMFPDACIAREILTLKVFCIYVDEGCNWSGEISALEAHLDVLCSYVRVACVFSSCGLLVKRSHLASHLEHECSERAVLCEYCSTSIALSTIKEHEKSQCNKFPETCSLCLTKDIPREEFKYHYEVCEEVEQECTFSSVGCKETKKMKKKHRKEHQQSFIAYHLELLLGILLMIREQIHKVLHEWTSFRDEFKTTLMDVMSQITALIISNTEIREELKTQGEKTKALEDSLTNEDGEICRKRSRAARSGENMNEFECENLKMEVRRLSQAVLELEDNLRRCRTELDSQNQVVGLSSLNLNDFEHNIQQLERTNYEGILLWKITDFAKRRREAITGAKTSFYSHCFYTSRYGYKMCARIYLNGDGLGKGTHISLFFVLMRSEYDALHRWSFRQKVTLMILDQDHQEHVIDAFRPDPNSSSFTRPRQEMNVASGCPKFFPLSELARHAYVKDDCMFIKVIVEGLD